MKSRHSLHRRQRGGASEDNGVSVTNIIVLAGMAIVLVLIYYYIYNDNKMQVQHIESFTDSEISLEKDEVVLALFYADWCPHCVRFKPEWDSMTQSLNNSKTGHGKRVRMMNVDCEKNKALANKYGIDGYPTIKVITMDGGKESVEDYSGERSESAIKQFITSM